MDKYKLNFLRWLTKGELPDEVLKTAIDIKNKGNKFTFKKEILMLSPQREIINKVEEGFKR